MSEKLAKDWQKAEVTLTTVKKTKTANHGRKARWPELEQRVLVNSAVTVHLHLLVAAKEINIADFVGRPS